MRITTKTVGELQDALARFARSTPVALADDAFVVVEDHDTIVYLTDDPDKDSPKEEGENAHG